MPYKPKIAIVGIGRWGKNLVKAFDKVALIKATASSGDPENIAWLSENYPRIRPTTNLAELAADKSIEAVVIATPINTHFEIARQMLSAGKHVFLEKPGSDNSKKMSALIAEAKKRNLILQIGYEFVYSSELQNIKNQLAGKKIKRVKFIWKKMGSFKTHPVVNLLVHELSIAKTFLGTPIEITKYLEEKGAHNPDKIHVEAKSGGTKLVFDIDRASATKEKTIVIETDSGKLEWKNKNIDIVDEEARSFISSIQTGRQPIVDGVFAKKILEIIETIPSHF